MGVRYNEFSLPYGKNVIAKAMLCMWCLSVWVGGIITIAYILFGQPVVYLCLPFSLSAFTIFMDERMKAGQHG